MKTHTIKKTLALLALCTAAVSAVAQNGYNMPFSQFGAGSSDLPFNLPMVTRMGGTAYTLSGNNFVNPFNPASYGTIERESFVFDMGVGLQLNQLRDPSGSLTDGDGNLAYLLVAMPVTRWWKLAAGLMPYSTMEYESVQTQSGAGYGQMTTTYAGGGGLNEVFLGSAFNLLAGSDHTPRLQAGVNVNFLTGHLQRNILYDFPSTTAYYINKRRYKETTVNNITLDFGLQMRQAVGSRFTLGLGVVYKPYMDLRVSDEALIYTYHTDREEYPVDTIFPAAGQSSTFKSNLEQAQTFGVGLSLERNKLWQVAADVTFADWQGMKYTEGATPAIFGDGLLRYGPYSRYALGLEKMGSMDASSYWGRINWSLGAHFAQGAFYLNTAGTDRRLDEWGVGAGVTLPMRKGRSLLTLSVGYRSLGDVDLLQHNTLSFGIAVSSCERWFVKRKYN